MLKYIHIEFSLNFLHINVNGLNFISSNVNAIPGARELERWAGWTGALALQAREPELQSPPQHSHKKAGILRVTAEQGSYRRIWALAGQPTPKRQLQLVRCPGRHPKSCSGLWMQTRAWVPAHSHTLTHRRTNNTHAHTHKCITTIIILILIIIPSPITQHQS